MGDSPEKDEPYVVTETFESELAAIAEKGKDIKGEQRICYQSIVERVANNVEVIKDLRAEHKSLRQKLAQLVKEKSELSDRTTLEGDLRHANHEVNFLRSQIDSVRNDKETSAKRQADLKVVLENFRCAEAQVHPEEAQIATMKDRLDRTHIKTEETTHLIKIYERIVSAFDRQKMRWAPAVRRSHEAIKKKDRDIQDLTFISRDSRFARDLAKSEYLRMRQQISEGKKERTVMLQRKTAQQIAQEERQMREMGDNERASRAQPSVNSQPSVLRNKLNKAAREKREERFRQISAVYDDIRERFSTNDPEKIQEFLRAKQTSIDTLRKQIAALDASCAELTKRSEQLRAAIEEAEYASAKGVGGNRLCAEGADILRAKREELTRTRREVATTESHQKEVAAGIAHLADALALVRLDEEELPTRSDELVRWVRAKCQETKQLLDKEDFDFTTVVSQPVFAQMAAAAERSVEDADAQKKARKAEAKRQREKGGDVQTRVLDRNSVKLQALKVVQAAQAISKKKEGK